MGIWDYKLIEYIKLNLIINNYFREVLPLFLFGVIYYLSKFRNLTGQHFGRWKALEYKGDAQWLCECSCEQHTKKLISSTSLVQGRSQSCGCLHKEQLSKKINTGKPSTSLHDLTGQRFGKLLVIKRIGTVNYKKPLWECLCDCGNTANVTTPALVNNTTLSCGCFRKEKIHDLYFKDITGQKFGRLIVIKQAPNIKGRFAWYCNCDCGTKNYIVSENALMCDNTTSCGCKKLERLKSWVGENHPNWKGTRSLTRYLRDRIQKWKDDSMKNCNYKCIISNQRFDVIHHLYPLYKIIDEIIQITKLPLYDEINKYTIDELSLAEKTCLELHYKYPLGVCLTRELHDEFHKIYSTSNFTPQDFYEFYKTKTGRVFNPSFLVV
jgi:hypothetical protein